MSRSLIFKVAGLGLFFGLMYQLLYAPVQGAGEDYVWDTPAWAPAPFDYEMKTGFADEVSPANAWPDYPRMQMRRERWLNLNGVWQLRQQQSISETAPTNQNFGRGILVPYPLESALSGVKESWDRAWYRRVFTIPVTWPASERILLHFEAVDFEAEVFVNGQSLGVHQGGYDRFSFDITPFLREPGTALNQELIVRVFDPSDSFPNPVGKQTNNPGGVFYSSSTGIWQTVWLEPVPPSHIDSLRLTPNVDLSRLQLQVEVSGPVEGISVEAVVKAGETVVAEVRGQAPNTDFAIQLSNLKLWSPADPFLYDLEVWLKRDGVVIDRVDSYFGMRKVSTGTVNGYKQVLLNNEPIFQRGVLDQGFWPDGLHTAPTDAALKWDLEKVLELGFTTDRKHIKREPDRWYYWADRLGVLVWQDMVSLSPQYQEAPEYPRWNLEMVEMVNELYNHPSIIMWVIFNEGWGQPDQQGTSTAISQTRQIDSSRIINGASGWVDYGGGDVKDVHCYPGPCLPDDPGRVNVIGEYGGISYELEGHLWNPGQRYAYPGQVYTSTDYLSSYGLKTAQIFEWAKHNGVNGYIYTQLTDVEIERNGIMTYDRRVIKAPPEAIRARNSPPE